MDEFSYAKKFSGYINSMGNLNYLKWFTAHENECPTCGAELDWQSQVYIDRNSPEQQEYASYCSCMKDSLWEHTYDPVTDKILSAGRCC